MRRLFHAQHGSTLLEVLVAVLVLAIGMLGLAALQARALQENQGAYHRTQANILAYDILDRMRANRPSVAAGKYNHDLDDDKPTGSSIIDQDLNIWLSAIEETLPQGKGSVRCSGTQCVVTVQWFEKSYNDDRDGDGDIDNDDKTLQIQIVSTL